MAAGGLPVSSPSARSTAGIVGCGPPRNRKASSHGTFQKKRSCLAERATRAGSANASCGTPRDGGTLSPALLHTAPSLAYPSTGAHQPSVVGTCSTRAVREWHESTARRAGQHGGPPSVSRSDLGPDPGLRFAARSTRAHTGHERNYAVWWETPTSPATSPCVLVVRLCRRCLREGTASAHLAMSHSSNDGALCPVWHSKQSVTPGARGALARRRPSLRVATACHGRFGPAVDVPTVPQEGHAAWSTVRSRPGRVVARCQVPALPTAPHMSC